MFGQIYKLRQFSQIQCERLQRAPCASSKSATERFFSLIVNILYYISLYRDG